MKLNKKSPSGDLGAEEVKAGCFFIIFRIITIWKMKNNRFAFKNNLIVFSFITLCISCQRESLITYEDALHNCKMDTMLMYGKGDTTKIPYFPISCIDGAQLPLFEFTFMDGKPINETYFKNKINVINFWFIGCHPCEAEMPGFNALVEKYKGSPVNFLAVSDNKPTDIEEFLTTHPFKLDHIALGESIEKDIFHITWGYPTTIVADADYKILYAKSGGRDDSLAIQKIQDELIPVIDGALKKM
jgi:thiol-disulfide isomerase/thioredoxin